MTGFDLIASMRRLMAQIVEQTDELKPIDMSRLLIATSQQRSRWRDGLFAQVIPLRFKDGQRTTRRHGATWAAPQVMHEGVEILYVISFCLPRFLHRSFDEKLQTVFHELYHISPAFDGDLRRTAGGRYHTKAFYAAVERMTRRYRAGPASDGADFLQADYRQLVRRHGSVVGRTFRVPHPRRMVEPDPEPLVGEMTQMALFGHEPSIGA